MRNILIKNRIIIVILMFTAFTPLSFGGNILNDCQNKFEFTEMYILESEQEDGKYLTGDISALGFEPYHWKELSEGKEFTDRMYTIRAEFFISSQVKDCDLAIFLGPADYPYTVYINNIMIAARGKLQKFQTEAVNSSVSERLSGHLIKYDDINTLAIQAFCGIQRSSISGVFISNRRMTEKEEFLRNLLNVNFALAIGFLSVILGLYFLFMFISQNFKDAKNLFFSFTGFFYALNTVNLSFFYNFADGFLLIILSRIGFIFCSASISLFTIEFVHLFKRRVWIILLIIVPGIVFSVMTILGKSFIEVDAFFSVVSLYYIFPLLLFILVLLIISVIKQKNRNSFIILCAFIVVISASLLDITNLISLVIPFVWLTPFGYTALVISIFFVLSIEQAAVYKKSIMQQEKLNAQNRSMQSIIEKIGIVSERLTISYKKLDNIISHSIDVIQNYENSNTMLIKDSVRHLDNVEEIVSNIKNRIEESNRRVPETITRQTSAAEHITTTVENMTTHLETTVQSSRKVNNVAHNLAEMAGTSSSIISESKSFISRIADYSKFITDILNTIEDITEKTKILSINAAIEAARAGITGKGFSVVAQEIRKLAQQSQTGLESSFIKIKEMQETINKSNILAEEVENSLGNIIEQSRHSASNINSITTLIQDQKVESTSILKDVQSFFDDIHTLKELSVNEVSENEKVKESLTALKNTFVSITNQLKDQMSKGDELQRLLADINIVMDDNIENVEILNKCIEDYHI